VLDVKIHWLLRTEEEIVVQESNYGEVLDYLLTRGAFRSGVSVLGVSTI